jgi:hypothetical protein
MWHSTVSIFLWQASHSTTSFCNLWMGIADKRIVLLRQRHYLIAWMKTRVLTHTQSQCYEQLNPWRESETIHATKRHQDATQPTWLPWWGIEYKLSNPIWQTTLQVMAPNRNNYKNLWTSLYPLLQQIFTQTMLVLVIVYNSIGQTSWKEC